MPVTETFAKISPLESPPSLTETATWRVVAAPKLVILSPLVEKRTSSSAALYSAGVAAPVRVITPVIAS